MSQELERRVSIIEKTLEDLTVSMSGINHSLNDLRVSIATFAANWSHYERPGAAIPCKKNEEQIQVVVKANAEIREKLDETRRVVFIIVGVGIALNFLQPYIIKIIGG